jgi:hypothetical protein
MGKENFLNLPPNTKTMPKKSPVRHYQNGRNRYDKVVTSHHDAIPSVVSIVISDQGEKIIKSIYLPNSMRTNKQY